MYVGLRTKTQVTSIKKSAVGNLFMCPVLFSWRWGAAPIVVLDFSLRIYSEYIPGSQRDFSLFFYGVITAVAVENLAGGTPSYNSLNVYFPS